MAPARSIFAAFSTIVVAILAANVYAKDVFLTTGHLKLRPVSQSDLAAAVASTASAAVASSDSTAPEGQLLAARLSASAGSSSSSSTTTSTTTHSSSSSSSSSGSKSASAPHPVWGKVRSRRLFILSYNDDAHARQIARGLAARQAQVLSYIPHQNLLVSAGRDAALRVAYEQGTEVAECDPSLKVAPEWEALLAAADRAAAATAAPADSGAAAAAVAQSLLSTMQVLPTTVGGSGGGGGGGGGGGQPRYGILVELLAGLPGAALAAAAAEWPEELAAALHAASGGGAGKRHAAAAAAACRPVVDIPAASPDSPVAASVLRLSIFLCRQDLSAGVTWLAALPEVKWVAPLRPPALHNAMSDILLQTGELTVEQYRTSLADNATALQSYTPYWQAGLQGQGEIIGVGDTGLDVDSCYFEDPRFSGTYASALADEFMAPRLQGLPFVRIPNHRKVVQYAIMKAGGNSGDALDRNGHGTAVSGCVAGSALGDTGSDPSDRPPVDGATGAAPLARLSIVDLSNDTSDSMVLPAELADGYLAVHKAAGAYIHSNSWGWPLNTYTYSKDFDKFLWENPAVISVNSAGNEGGKAVRRSSINEPSVAKNVVSVGAGTRMSSSLEGSSFTMYKVTATWRNGQVDENMFYPAELRRLPLLLSDVIPDGGKLRMVMADPLGACKSLRRLRLTPRGAVVMVTAPQPTQCSSYTQARRVADAGGVAMLVIQPDNVQPRTPRDPVDPDTGQLFNLLPMAGVNLEWGQYLMSVSNNDSLVELTVSKAQGLYDSDVIHWFSSAGPLPDGRIKPDIIAPGFGITSAAKTRSSSSVGSADVSSLSGDTCKRVEQQTGTSFAAPLVAGHLALMRQYLRSGFYPTGSPTDGELRAPFTPSGMLLKALMVAGAKSLEGGVAMLKGGPMGPSPDGFQGWGRFNLAGSLPLEGFTDPRVRLQLADWGAFRATGENASMGGLVATGTGPVTVVLSYYDYPGDSLANGATVNNLDLVVELTGPSGGIKRVLGNAAENTASPRPDRVNTVERVKLAAPPNSTALRIIINATALPSTALDPSTPQRWAVAVVGHFSGDLATPLNPAWAVQAGLPQHPSSPSFPSLPPPRAPPPARKPPRNPRRRPPPSTPPAVPLIVL